MARYGYDYLDARIVDGLSKYTPRKIHQISVVLKAPESTVRHRIHRMLRLKLLEMSVNPRYASLGLIPVVVQFKYKSKYSNELINALKANPYALCIQRAFGSQSEIFALYTVPLRNKKFLVYYLDRVVDTEFADDYRIEWVINHHRVHHSYEWYDPETKSWTIDVDKLYNRFNKALDEVGMEEIYELEEKVFNLIQDEYDIYLLSSMEDEGDISLSKVATKVNTTVQNLHYHFHRHILGNDLVESYIIHFKKFLKTPILHPVFYIDFDRREHRKAFSEALEGLAFIEFNSHILGGKRLVQTTTMPIGIFVKYVKLLDQLMKEGYVTTYQHYFLVGNIVECKKKLPYELYSEGRWEFDEDEYLKAFST